MLQNGYKSQFFRVDVVIFRIIFKCSSCFSGSKNYCQVSSLGKRTDGRQRLELLFQLDKDSTEFTGKRHFLVFLKNVASGSVKLLKHIYVKLQKLCVKLEPS